MAKLIAPNKESSSQSRAAIKDSETILRPSDCGTFPDPSDLRLQNDALRNALSDSEAACSRYQDLYEHAPVGYLVIDERAVVLATNVTGATLLGEEQQKIIGSPFLRFTAPTDQVRCLTLLDEGTEAGVPQTIELKLQRGKASTFDAQIDYVRVAATGGGAPIVRLTIIDITQRKTAESEIEHLAFYDHLTALPNRRLLLDRLQHALLACVRTHDHGAVFFIDLDGFKTLNDRLGHAMGDLLLQQVAQRLTTCIRECDTVARLGGDEFVVMIEQLNHEAATAASQAKAIGEKILSIFDEGFPLGGEQYFFTGSVGVTLFRDNHESVKDLLKRADLALYRAKNEGRSTMRLFDPEMEAAVKARNLLDADLRLALHEEQLVLYYQAQVDQNGTLTGAEVLLRWQHPVRGLLGPEEIIPFAEERGIIGLIGQWVLKAACLQLNLWSTSTERSHLKLAINVSAHEFSHPEFVARMLRVLDQVGADPRRLVLELTETVTVGSLTETLEKMHALKARGICFSLDDFGIGYSSLAYLQSLPLNQLKIDRAFVRNVLTNTNDATIARSIIALGNSLGLSVIAEGVESREQRDLLASFGCQAFQGFLFGQPGPVGSLRF